MRHGQLKPPVPTLLAAIAAAALLSSAPSPCRAEDPPEPPAPEAEAAAAEDRTREPAEDSENVDWRHDPSVERRPGSYLGGGIDYTQVHVFVEENEDHDALEFSPLHTWGINFRVGDAFTDWFAIGFQMLLSTVNKDGIQSSMFSLMLDASFYPWKGLGIRPAAGIGMGFVQGENDWEMGTGGPGCVSLALLYEIRVTRFFSIAPMAQAVWIVSDGYDGVYLFIGLEFTKWFRTATG